MQLALVYLHLQILAIVPSNDREQKEMRKKNSVRVLFMILSAIMAQTLTIPAISTVNSAACASSDQMTKQAAALVAQGKVDDAVTLESKAISVAPDYWLPHSALSYLSWKKSDLEQALSEGKLAVKLSPNNAFALANLAKVQQNIGYYEDALDNFTKASKLSPGNWVPWIGQAQCLVLVVRQPDAVKLLDEMTNENVTEFEWFYQIADVFVKMDKAKLAEPSALKAVSLASNPEQKSLALCQLFNVYLRAGDVEKGRGILKETLSTKPKDKEIYLRAANLLYSADKPEDGVVLLNTAIENATPDADLYYAMGKDFQTRSVDTTIDASKQSVWLDLAEKSFREAIKINPGDSKEHLALAGVLERKGNSAEVLQELEKAQTDNVTGDPLAPYLISKLKVNDNDLAAQLRKKMTGAADDAKANTFNLTKVGFSLTEVHCACKIPAIEMRLKKTNGVACAGVPKLDKPYKGFMLVDQSISPVQAIVDNFAKTPGIGLQVSSSEPVKSASEAIRLSQSLHDIQPLNLMWAFHVSSPKMPIE